MDIRKEIHKLILECLVKKPPKLILIDETLGGMTLDADTVVETIMMKLGSLYFVLLGRERIKDRSRAEYDIRRETAELFLKELGIIKDEAIEVINRPCAPEPEPCDADLGGRDGESE